MKKDTMPGNITLTCLGSGDAFGSGGRMNTCFHISSGKRQFLIDCGATSLIALKKQGFSIADIDYILITHFHGDHYGGLPFILLDSLHTPRKKPLSIVGPEGIDKRTWQLMDLLYPGSRKQVKEEMYIFSSYTPGQAVEIDDELQLLAYPVLHALEAEPHGLRIKLQNKIISYSGDTEWTDTLLLLSKDADLFICECTFYNTLVKGHLNYSTLMDKLPLLKCKRILLTHLDEEMLQNLDRVKLECASDGKEIRIK